ncbi:hypothetical protein N2152v2_004833 [Parachlorella kessleri]
MALVTPLEYTAVGAVAGVVEVAVLMPSIALKNALQEGRPVPRTVSALYRGLGMNALANFPITAVQFGASRLLVQAYERATGQKPGSLARVGVAMGAGATSALLSCPAELLVIQQQKTGLTLSAAAGGVLRDHGLLKLYKGLSSTAIRGALYTASYMAALPSLKDYLQQHTVLGSVPGAPLVASGICAGFFGTLTTQPVDTIKTRMQAFPDSQQQPQYRSMLSTARHILRSQGARALFHGLLPRAFRNCGAVIILNTTMTELVGAIDDHRLRQARQAAAAQPWEAFGLWGDMVIFLKDGSRLELVGLERFSEIRAYILEHIQ